MKYFAAILAIVVLALLTPFVLGPAKNEGAAPANQALPWQIEKMADGRTRVFGLIVGSSTLEEARRQLSGTSQMAIIAPNAAPASLEVYYESLTLGPLSGKMVLTLDATAAELDAMQTRAAKGEFMPSGAKKYLLNEADLAAAEKRAVRSIAFIPSPNLDEQIIVERFGRPVERIRQGETLEHFLYPDKGLDVVLDSKGKEVLQYVAPKNFAALREPLLTAPKP